MTLRQRVQEADPWPHAASPLIFQDNSFGPVQLDDAQEDYSGCVDLSNNTVELSAIPHILVRMLRGDDGGSMNQKWRGAATSTCQSDDRLR